MIERAEIVGIFANLIDNQHCVSTLRFGTYYGQKSIGNPEEKQP